MQIKMKILIIILILSSFLIHVINVKFIYYHFTSPLIRCFSGFWILIAVIPLYILPLIWLSLLIYIIKKYKEDEKIKLLWIFLPIVFIFPGSVTLYGIGVIFGIP